MSERYEPGTELYAARDCQGWQWQRGDSVVASPAWRGDFLGKLLSYWESGDYLTTERYGARYDWDVRDVTAGAVQQELGL